MLAPAEVWARAPAAHVPSLLLGSAWGCAGACCAAEVWARAEYAGRDATAEFVEAHPVSIIAGTLANRGAKELKGTIDTASLPPEALLPRDAGGGAFGLGAGCALAGVLLAVGAALAMQLAR